MTGHYCTSKGANVCSSCDEGFHLQDFRCTATTATCTCANGVAATDALCPGGEFCTVCDAGFHLFNRKCKAHSTARYDLAATPTLKYDTGFNGHRKSV